MLKLLQILLTEFHEKLEETSENQLRDFKFVNLPSKIKVAIGMRRTGKTSCLFQTIRELIKEKQLSLRQILYLNFEDDRLIPCSQDKLRNLIEAFYELYPSNHDKPCYLFFDEIQNVENWPVLIRRIFDTKKVQIFLCGSSSKLLSKEIHTSLRGRAIAQEVWPYSFKEYLSAHKVQLKSKLLDKKNQDTLSHYLRTYIEAGGFPETTNMHEEERRQVLQDYVDIVIMRDIVERHNITNITLIKYLIKFIVKNSGNSFSINKFVNDLKTQGISCSKNTLYDYLNYIEDTYLAFTIPVFSESIRKSHVNPRKTYTIDSGLVRAYSFGIAKNLGHLFENLIFLDFKRRGFKVYYYLTQERYEVDFLTIDKRGNMKLHQVVWDKFNKETMEREQRALNAARKELNIPGEIITTQTYLEQIWKEIK